MEIDKDLAARQEARLLCRRAEEAQHLLETFPQEKLDAILACARLAPSACNAQPYHITVCKGETAKAAAKASKKKSEIT